ncbi:hypothetical protein C499_07345 [Halogeometricum borinquense DSM 11551]|uniref:Uncharacterized protein n=1 Tax=Halogeometricum borinquense (strain ATCC 700274 / DSM 11551 / JCM 10706 / KCTC 4070 / PR3) TaxID=469382 RepID=E4NVF9_HALBP|nr:hypothetical protein Hbor_33180 [Halogeometricum borinquense DSM 11551]ELY28727.1 hypothetical protein C499_07345 [Halogeometricum borinquense DSM 11551]
MQSELASRFNEFFGKEEFNHPVLVATLQTTLSVVGILFSYLYIRPVISLNMGPFPKLITLLLTIVVGICLFQQILFLAIHMDENTFSYL